MLVDVIMESPKAYFNGTKTLEAFVKNNTTALAGCGAAFIIIAIIIIIIYRRIKAIREAKPNIKKRAQNVGEDDFEYTADNEERHKLGYLSCHLLYDDKGFLKIDKIQCISLFSPDNTRLDTYVKVRIEPKSWKIKERQTKVVQNSTDPLFNCFFSIKISANDLKQACVVWEIMDKDLTIGKDTFLGVVRQSLSNMDIDVLRKSGIPIKLKIKDSDEEIENYGDICIVIRNQPLESKVTITIVEAKSLNMRLRHKYPPVYATVSLFYDSSKLFSKTTETRYNTDCPYFNESYTFPLKVGKTANSYVVIRVMKKRVLFDKCIGEVLIGFKSEAWSGRKQWNDMIANPKRAIALWHSLCKTS